MSLQHQILTLLLLVAVSWAAMAFLMAHLRLRPPRLSDARALSLLKRLTPEDLGIPFQSLYFAVPSQGQSGHAIRLAAWYVPHPQANGRLVVLLHGYSDAKVGAAAWLPMLHSLKVNVLLLDLPAHGDSEGHVSTAGWYERYQVAEVVRQLRELHPDDVRRVVLFGISQGAAVCLATTCAAPAGSFAGVIIDSPYSNVREASVLHADLFGLPGAWLQRPASWIIEHVWGIDYDSIAPVNLLREIACPVLLIEASRDALVRQKDAERMRDAVLAKSHQDGKSRVLGIENAPHIMGLAMAPRRYAEAVASFLSDDSSVPAKSAERRLC